MSTPHQLRRPATSEAIEHAFGLFNAKAKRNVDLSQFTTYKVGGTAALHMMVSSIDDLYLVSAVLAEVELPNLVVRLRCPLQHDKALHVDSLVLSGGLVYQVR